MGERGDVRSLVDLVDDRATLLEHLVDDPASVDDLVHMTAVSRSTVDRGLAELTDAGLVEPTAGGYRLTLFGRLVYGQYVGLASFLHDLTQFADRLGTLPSDTNLPPVVVRKSRAFPDARRHLSTLLGRADGIHVLLAAPPPGLPPYLEGIGSASVRILLPAPALRRLASDGSRHPFGAADIQLRQTDDPLPFTLVLADDGIEETVAVCGHAGGQIDWLLAGSDDEVLSWGRAVVERRWRAGTALPSPG